MGPSKREAEFLRAVLGAVPEGADRRAVWNSFDVATVALMIKSFSRDAIEKRLRLHILNLCLGSVGGKEDDLRAAKVLLIDEIMKLLGEVAEETVDAAFDISQKIINRAAKSIPAPPAPTTIRKGGI